MTILEKNKKLKKLPVQIYGGKKLFLSGCKFYEIELITLNEFAPRFASGSILYYLGDTQKRILFHDIDITQSLGLELCKHHKMPDIIFYNRTRNWLFLIEIATFRGPITPNRLTELNEIFRNSNAGIVFVSVFPSFKVFNKYANCIAWDTEIWIAEKELYSHLIHYNGDKFFGPR